MWDINLRERERERVVYWKFANAETTFYIYYKYVPPTITELNVKKIMYSNCQFIIQFFPKLHRKNTLKDISYY
jgi:hypothetical protein